MKPETKNSSIWPEQHFKWQSPTFEHWAIISLYACLNSENELEKIVLPMTRWAKYYIYKITLVLMELASEELERKWFNKIRILCKRANFEFYGFLLVDIYRNDKKAGPSKCHQSISRRKKLRFHAVFLSFSFHIWCTNLYKSVWQM